MDKILVIRLSANGDVAMTIPVIYSAAKENPEISFTVLTQTFLTSLFINRPQNVDVIGIDIKHSEKTLISLSLFGWKLRRYKFNKIIDLHNVIRSRIIDFVFQLQGKSVYKINKGRKERKLITRKPPKTIRPLPSVFERYINTFKKAGVIFNETFTSLFDKSSVDEFAIREMVGEKQGRWIGIAPFAKHQGKIYPLEKMEKVIENLSEREDLSIFLFGGKGVEEELLTKWESRYAHTKNMAGKFSLNQELSLISCLDLFLCMDSANMHFASLVGTKVISVWGSTHPYAGFYGYNQSYEMAIQTDLSCRPCSIFGNKPCYRGDWACLTEITPEMIVQRVTNFLETL